jgi:5'(3')-deoxyribonucleotidase
MTRRLLAVDIDNTLADYTSALRDVAAAYGGYACPDPTEYDFSLAPDWPFSGSPAAFRRFHTHAVANGLYGAEQVYPHALDALAALHGDWRIVIATSRPDDGSGATARWLAANGVPRDGLFFGDKAALGADAYLEDRPETCAQLSGMGAIVLRPPHAYCAHAAGQAFDWASLPERLKEMS